MAYAKATPAQYVAWVQRSLNRYLGSNLADDGVIREPLYRNVVKKFQATQYLAETGQVDEPTQNELIMKNHEVGTYRAWVRMALTMSGAYKGGPSTDPLDAIVFAALEVFQKANNLRPSTWVGPNTETWLMMKTGTKPPVGFISPPPAPVEPSVAVAKVLSDTNLKFLFGISVKLPGRAFHGGVVGDSYGKIADAVHEGRIGVEVDAGLVEKARYDHHKNTFFFRSAPDPDMPFDRSTIVHEGTHAVCDRAGRTMDYIFSEQLAFVAECLYFQKKFAQRKPSNEASIYPKANDVADVLRHGGLPSDALLNELYTNISNDPGYQGNVGNYVAYNGIPASV